MRINTKAKGSNAERELFKMFWNSGWACVRSAGSGSNRYPSPDLLAANGIRMVAIEVKILADMSKYFPKKEISELKTFARLFGAEPWVCVKFGSEKWSFVKVDDLVPSENSFVLSLARSKEVGFDFDRFVSMF